MRQPQTFSYGDYVTDWTTRLLKICPSYQILDIRTKQVVLRTPECLIVRENSLCRLSYFIIQLGMQGLQHRGHFLYREAGTEKLTPAQAELGTQSCCKAPLDLTQLCEGQSNLNSVYSKCLLCKNCFICVHRKVMTYRGWGGW